MDTKTIVALLTEIRDLLTEIRDHQRANLASQTVLDERREKDRERKRLAKFRGIPRKEKNEEAREEKSPHTPLKGEREEERKVPPNACARAGKARPTFDEVAAYCRKRGGKGKIGAFRPQISVRNEKNQSAFHPRFQGIQTTLRKNKAYQLQKKSRLPYRGGCVIAARCRSDSIPPDKHPKEEQHHEEDRRTGNRRRRPHNAAKQDTRRRGSSSLRRFVMVPLTWPLVSDTRQQADLAMSHHHKSLRDSAAPSASQGGCVCG